MNDIVNMQGLQLLPATGRPKLKKQKSCQFHHEASAERSIDEGWREVARTLIHD